MKQIRLTYLLVAVMLVAGCGKQHIDLSDYNVVYAPEYAHGFEILGADGAESSIIVTKAAWQGADSSAVTRLFVARNGETAPDGFDGQVLKGNAQRIVCMSSTHIAMLDAIGDADLVVGVSGIDYVSNPSVQSRRDEVADVGYEGSVDYERLVSLDPDIVLLFGISGANTMEPKLRELRIPYMYVGEYLEQDPLGKAEWLVAVNELTGKREQAASHFAEIPARYNALKELVADAEYQPVVMMNTPYGDQWIMPSNRSYSAQLIRDAGGRLAYDRNTDIQSMPIDIEEAYLLTEGADKWIGVGQIRTMDELKAMLTKFADTNPVVNGEVWNCNLRATPAGGNDYWEGGVVHPDLILQDLILILHPDALPDAQFTYYKQLPS